MSSVHPARRKYSGSAVHAPLRSISSRTLVFTAREVKSGGEAQQRRLCRNGNAAQLLRRRSFAFRLYEKCHRANKGGDSPKTALRLCRGRCGFLCPGGYLAEQTTAATLRARTRRSLRQISSPSLFLSARQVDSGGEEAEPTLPKWHRRSIIPPLLPGALPEPKSVAGHMTKATFL